MMAGYFRVSSLINYILKQFYVFPMVSLRSLFATVKPVVTAVNDPPLVSHKGMMTPRITADRLSVLRIV